MIKAVLFDNDGVLLNTDNLYFEVTSEVISTVNINATKEIYIEYCLKQGKSLFDYAIDKGIDEQKIIELRKKRTELYQKYLSNKDLTMPGIDKILEYLHGKVKLGIITSARRNLFEIMHKNTGLLKYFDFIITREDYDKSKPNPDPYLKGLETAKVKADESIAIEDSEKGIISANAANIKCIGMPSDLYSSGDFSKAIKVVNDPDELLEYIKGKI